jgi:hypothetical protein
MQIFGISEAEYYCRAFSASSGASAGSLRQYFATGLKGVTVLREGTMQFSAYRDCALRDAERCLFVGASHLRRSVDLMIPSSSHWAQVTLYYGSFFTAYALLGMFGAWVGPLSKAVVGVRVGQPGSQELFVDRKPASTYNGSHQKFWDFFYSSCRHLDAWIDPTLRIAVTPLSGNVAWQTDARNDVNYDSFRSLQLAAQFKATFSDRRFPASLPGDLNGQYMALSALLTVAFQFARQFGLRTDGLSPLRPRASRNTTIRDEIFRAELPKLSRKIGTSRILI